MDELDRRYIYKGRGTVSNDAGRFEPHQRVAIDDGWDSADASIAPLETILIEDTTRTIIARNDSPDVPFDRSINPYRGCEHGCVYCFARPTHAYLGFSPGLDFESRLLFKPNAAPLLDQALRKKGYRCQPMALGTNTDPYQPIERKLGITRQIIETLNRFNHPLTIVTKGVAIERDIDILASMAERRLVRVAVSITTLDRALARAMEPRAATPERRFQLVRTLSDAGIPTNVMTAPVIPGLTDHELEQLLAAAKDYGAHGAGYVLLRLPHEIKTLFAEWLETHYPLKASRVLSLVRETRGGALNSSQWGQRMKGEGVYADLIGQRFRRAVQKLGLKSSRYAWELDMGAFHVPTPPNTQLSLF